MTKSAHTTKTTNPAQAAWLEYAWSVVSPQPAKAAHLEQCRIKGGAPIMAGLSRDYSGFRLPGYLGPSYEPDRGVLIVGTIFKVAEVADSRFRPALDAALSWRTAGRGPKSDADFLADTARAFRATMPEWFVWKRLFGPILDTLGLQIEDIAYTNVAKCWCHWRGYVDRNLGKNLASNCNVAFSPLRNVFEAIRPRQVFMVGSSAPRSTQSVPETFVLNQTHRTAHGFDMPWPEWLPLIRERYVATREISA